MLLSPPAYDHPAYPLTIGKVACRRCGDECNGSVMRTDVRSTRTRHMILDEAPRVNGIIALCHRCQRWAHFAGSVTQLLARDVRREARRAACAEAVKARTADV